MTCDRYLPSTSEVNRRGYELTERTGDGTLQQQIISVQNPTTRQHAYMAHPSPNGQAWDSDKNDKKVGYGPDTGRTYEHKEWKGKGSGEKKEDGVEALLEMQDSDIASLHNL